MLAELKDICDPLYNPPVSIQLLNDAICVALGVNPSWENAKREVWGDDRLIQRLRAYDGYNLRPAVMQKLKSIVEDPSFHPSVVGKFSAAAAGICEWIHALVAPGAPSPRAGDALPVLNGRAMPGATSPSRSNSPQRKCGKCMFQREYCFCEQFTEA